jgi:hypothetical protein
VSLIDEALKRAQAAGQKDGAPPGERPWIPSPMPDPSLARRRRLLPVAAVAAVVAAAVSAVFLFLPRPGVRAPTIATEPDGGEGKPAAAAAPIVQPATVPTAGNESLPTPVPPRPRPTQPVPPPESEAQVEGENVAPPAQPVPQGPGVTSGKTYAGAASLPGGAKIELGGIVWSEAEPRALLNDRVAAVGAYVEGFTLTRIEQDRVALEKDGVTIFISVK